MTKARPTKGYSPDLFKDLDSQPAPAALNETGVGQLKSLLHGRPAAPVTPLPTAAVEPPTQPAPAAPTPVSTARPGAVKTEQSNMRIPLADADLIKTIREELDMSNGELITTAIGDLYMAGVLADLFQSRPQPGALFETRATRLPLKRQPDTVHVMVSYRLTPSDFATLDRIQREVGARSRGQLITTALREWVRRNHPQHIDPT